MRNFLIGLYVFMSFFFVRFLVFELWSIFYSTVVNSALVTQIFANLIQTQTSQTRVSIQKYAGSKSAASLRGVKGEASTNFF